MYSPGSLDRKLLLEIARQALYAAVERHESLENLPKDGTQAEATGAFVTLRKRGRLRGCIGQVGTGQPLVEVVAHCAKAAALEDPRFQPVRPEELAEIEIEISALSPLQEISPDAIEPGKHGLMVSRGYQRGLLLPQVATGNALEWPQTAGRNLRKGGAGPRGLARSADENSSIHSGSFQRIGLGAKKNARPQGPGGWPD